MKVITDDKGKIYFAWAECGFQYEEREWVRNVRHGAQNTRVVIWKSLNTL